MSVSPLPFYQKPIEKIDRKTLQPCPSWCTHHQDAPSGERTHSGQPAVFFAEGADSGRRVDVGLWLEYRDYGDGVTQRVMILRVEGAEDVEMSNRVTHEMSKTLEGLMFAGPASKERRPMCEEYGQPKLSLQPGPPQPVESVPPADVVARNNRGGRI